VTDKENFHGYVSPETESQPEMQQHMDPKRVKEDLLALGIDIDYHVIGRMQKLGLSNTWSTTSKAANSLRKRNPYGVPSDVSYQNLDNVDEASMMSKDHREQEKEWSQVDQTRIRRALMELENRNSPLPPTSRVNALKLVQIFKIQYNRSADKFVSTMLAQKNRKGLIRAGQLMKTRFVLHSTFSEMVLRLHKKATADVIAVLFTIIAEDTEINGLLTKVIDLKAFLLLLRLANDDTRRSYDDKTSKVANEVEFWNLSRRDTPNGHTNTPLPKGKQTSRGQLHTSKGTLHEQYRRSLSGPPVQSKSPRKTKSNLYYRPRPCGGPVPRDLSNPHKVVYSVAESMGTESREMERKGRGVKGSFYSDVMRGNTSVASVLNAVEHRPATTDPRRMRSTEYIPRSRHSSVQDMKREMHIGTGVPHALGMYVGNRSAPMKCPDVKPAELTRATSFNEYYMEGTNDTRVPDALHFKQER